MSHVQSRVELDYEQVPGLFAEVRIISQSWVNYIPNDWACLAILAEHDLFDSNFYSIAAGKRLAKS